MCVVGDSDQSVYRWRGADIRNILEFERAFPNVTTIMLEQNFRSTQTILDAANAVIANNIGRQPKELFTVGDTGGPVKRYRAEDERDEAAWVSSEILRLHASEGLSWGDVAVFYRTNAQSPPARDVHEVQRHPLQGGRRAPSSTTAARSRTCWPTSGVLANPDDEVSARRIVNVPKRGIGDTSVARLAAWAQVDGVPVQRGDRPGRGGRAHGKALKGAEQLSKTLAELRPLVQTINPADFVQLVADRTGYLAELVAEHTHEADGRIENLAELATQAGDFDDVTGFLETVALVADSDELDSDGTRVSLMTLHTAKGLEYPAVFVVGLEEGIFPHFRVAGRAERARGGAPPLLRRHHPGPPAPGHLARLVAHDVGAHPAGHAEPLRDRGAGAPGRGRRARLAPARHRLRHALGRRAPAGRHVRPGGAAGGQGRRGQGEGPRGSTGAEDLGLAPGDEVVHDHWGRGVVVSAKGEGSRAQATVDFDSVGKKNLLLSATPLRRA